MATYYVRSDGSDSNTGTGPATNQAWQTITKAIGATGIAPGDTLYIAPGVYRGLFTAAFTNPTSEGQRVTIAGNPTASQFSGVSSGPVVITNFVTNTTTTTGDVFIINKDFITIQDINFVGLNPGGSPFYRLFQATATNMIVQRCGFYQPTSGNELNNTFFNTSAGGVGPIIRQSVFMGGTIYLYGSNHSGTWDSGTLVQDCYVQNSNTSAFSNIGIRIESATAGQYGGIKIINCHVIATTAIRGITNISTTFPSLVQNCILEASTGIFSQTNNGQITQSYNVIQASTALTNVASSVTTVTNAFSPSNASLSKIQGWGDYPFISALVAGQAGINAGINTNSLLTDIYGTTWNTPATPTIGAAEYQSYTPSSQYLPTERNASTITIAPGSTSQSIELYLGATGLAFNTSGLSAYYIRNRSAPVPITLVTQTAAGAWTSGGFAQISSSLTPGVYRLDIPDAALAAGADDVTVVVRGASGTNGAVMTVKLSSGGLTSAQTASAVWGASPAGYNDATTFGGVVNQIDQTVTSIDTEVQDIPSNVWDELKANHTIPNSFGDYLDTKVSTGADTSRIQLRQGPFLIKQNAIDSVITEVNQFLSTVPNIEMVLIDSSGGSVSVAGATLVMRVRNQAGTAVVNNVTPTVAYADGGVIRWSPNLSWTALGVTTAGTYRIVVERTMSGVTTTFGPFLVQLSSG